VPGDGCIDYKLLFKLINDINYNGWLVVEAEQDPKKANPYTYSKMGFDYLNNLAKEYKIEVERA
jgi:inosose dehydratase